MLPYIGRLIGSDPNNPLGGGLGVSDCSRANRLRQHDNDVGFRIGRQCEQIMARMCQTITIGIKPYCFVRTIKKQFAKPIIGIRTIIPVL